MVGLAVAALLTILPGAYPGSGAGFYVQSVPIENRLSAGATGFLRTVSKNFRQLRKVLGNAATRWRSWLGGAAVFLVLAVTAPVLDRSLLRIWQYDGGRAFLNALFSALVVYVRLLFDGRTPALGKALIAFAVWYGVAGADLMPDRFGLIWGLSDDIILIVLSSRSFMKMCPDELISEHAAKVAARRAIRSAG